MDQSKKDRKRKIDDISAATDSNEATEPLTKKQKLNLASNDTQKLPENTNNNTNIMQNVVEQVDLPPEILVSIFCQLSRADLARAGAVCQHWWLVSKDESLSWYPIQKLTFIEDEYTYSMYGLAQKTRESAYPGAGSPVKVSSIEFKGGICIAVLEDRQGRTAALGRIENSFYDQKEQKYYYTAVDQRFNEILKQTDSYRVVFDRIEESTKTLFRHSYTFEANLSKLEQKIRVGDELAIKSHIRLQTMQKMDKKYEQITHYFQPKESYLPTVLPVITEQPQSLTGVKLHNYQINAINWMVTTEKEKDEKFEVSPLIDTGIPNILLKYTMKEEKLVLFEDKAKHNLEFKAKGGVLADEMGLGKTVEMIGLMLSNPMKQAPKNEPYFATKATLVLCPNHLVDQWVKEVEKHTEPKLNVIQLTTIAQIKKVSYQQIIDADVVVVTYNLLKNKNYLAYPAHGTQIKMDAAAPHDRIDRVDKMLEDLKNKAPEKIKGVILDHFHWHRLVMDEGHEIIEDEFVTDVISYMQRTFSWYMSGTPFPKLASLEKVRKFLDFFLEPQINAYAYEHTLEESNFIHQNWDGSNRRPFTEMVVEKQLNHLLIDNLVWRNTKESVNQEYQMVATKPEVVLLDFTPIEAAIYDYLVFNQTHHFLRRYNRFNKDPIRELCCKLDYDWGSTLEAMREFMITRKLSDIETIKQRIQVHKDTKLNYEAELNSGKRVNDMWWRQTANNFLADYQKNLDTMEKVLEGLNKLLKVFQDIKPRDTSKIQYNTKDYWIENYGTKMASLVGYLKNLFEKEPTTRVIVFSQFTDYLDMIAALLEENNINSSMVEGNIYKKSKALKKFKADDSDVQVILLSLSKAASGTNLIEASHVLLMDPMTGTKEEAQAYENQAIGRAQRQGQTKPVTVVRFVIKNTIEHEFYVRNTGSKPVTLTRTNSKLVRSSSFGTLNNNN